MVEKKSVQHFWNIVIDSKNTRISNSKGPRTCDLRPCPKKRLNQNRYGAEVQRPYELLRSKIM
jgi:hypothetical protein